MGRPVGSKNRPRDVDLSILTPEERDQIELEVMQEAEDELKAQAKAQLKDRLKKVARQERGLDEEQVTLFVDLAPYCDRILLDNIAYLQGMTYTVPASRAQVMAEVMQRTWGHQSEIDGKSENFYRKSRGQRVVPAGNGAAVVNTSNLLRA